MSTTLATTTELTRVLRHQHALVRRLQLATASVRLLLGAGEGRFLTVASDEVHELLDAIGVVESMRASLAADLATRLGLDADASLSELVAVLPEHEAAPLGTVGATLRDAVAELDQVGADGAGLADTGLARLRVLLNRVTAPQGPTYGPTGQASPAVASFAFDRPA